MAKIKNENAQYKIITDLSPDSVAAESYRRIKVGLEYSSVDKKVQVVQICSSYQSEGKTLTLLNLAATYAEEGKKVVIVDLDFRRPKIHRAFKVENKLGISDYLAGNAKKEEVIKSNGKGISFINSGSKVPYPTALLSSEAVLNFINLLRTEFDMILLDCPPILAVTDAIVVSKLADGCLFIVSQKVTEKPAAKEAVSILRKNNVNLLGCVFVGIDKKNSDYRGSKYHYYQNYSNNEVNK